MRGIVKLVVCGAIPVVALVSCAVNGPEEPAKATVRIKNDFNNPEIARRPPWTICKCNYQGVEFGEIPIGDSSEVREVEPGLGHVLMVLAWDDPTCSPEKSLPVASRYPAESIKGQSPTIVINAPNHQGPCPPEGVGPITEELYNRILALYPEYGFKPYAQRTQNPQCLP